VRRSHVAIALLILGALLVMVGLLVGEPGKAVLEGTYCNRTNCAAAYVGGGPPGLLDAGDGNLWIGAGLAVTSIAATVALRTWRSAAKLPQ
jgi:hypothetical protein